MAQEHHLGLFNKGAARSKEHRLERKKRVFLRLCVLVCAGAVLAYSMQAARSHRLNISDTALYILPLSAESGNINTSHADNDYAIFWRNDTEALLADQSGHDGGAGFRKISLNGGIKIENIPIPACFLKAMQPGNHVMSISPDGDYVLIVAESPVEHHVTEIAADGTILGEWHSKNTRLDASLFAPTGPGWVEFHSAYDGTGHRDFYVHYPGKRDIQIKVGNVEAQEEYSNGNGEVFSHETELTTKSKIERFHYTGIWQNPGKEREVSLILPSDYDIYNVAANPVNSDLLFSATAAETPVFTNKWLRKIPYFRDKIHPARMVILRCKMDGTGLVEIGEVAKSLAPKNAVGYVDLAWLPDGKRYSIVVDGKLYICNAYR
jgi:hypothetical protein